MCVSLHHIGCRLFVCARACVLHPAWWRRSLPAGAASIGGPIGSGGQTLSQHLSPAVEAGAHVIDGAARMHAARVSTLSRRRPLLPLLGTVRSACDRPCQPAGNRRRRRRRRLRHAVLLDRRSWRRCIEAWVALAAWLDVVLPPLPKPLLTTKPRNLNKLC